ncbi:hypothetical protein [Corticicoccus populi]|uniref:Uncharacterized protein n=1 Tax=Corticicoccus populi TaxID=1812821 RepID=A0ABW5X072_9STAP
MKYLTANLSNVYRQMIASAYALPAGTTFSTGSLYNSVHQQLNTKEKQIISRKLSHYLQNNSEHFAKVGKSGNNYIYRRL